LPIFSTQSATQSLLGRGPAGAGAGPADFTNRLLENSAQSNKTGKKKKRPRTPTIHRQRKARFVRRSWLRLSGQSGLRRKASLLARGPSSTARPTIIGWGLGPGWRSGRDAGATYPLPTGPAGIQSSRRPDCARLDWKTSWAHAPIAATTSPTRSRPASGPAQTGRALRRRAVTMTDGNPMTGGPRISFRAVGNSRNDWRWPGGTPAVAMNS